ncbi:hypothetical protein BPNPMPFG_000298 [Mesorhizobium sp. AR07]|uniref:hypothetical protein n=1 Tax=Mesorhizobium sp. AR07 TaxID=2865838 RepID=UPI00215FECBC|nr:hypothetical protein [Mesorhizobium sp. AR07]UVK44833.1 hypothetical protein BPNPMPFG_000298 [Mesorhizobium sp. AR07]
MEQILDLTGLPARFDGALRGKRIAWQAFAELTGADEAAGVSTMIEFARDQYCAEGVRPIMSGGSEYVRQTGALAARPIPEGATLRRKLPRPCPEPRPKPQYWLGRMCTFARRYTDPTRRWRGWKPRPPEQATVPFLALLAPLSATALAKHYIASLAVPKVVIRAPVARRRPIAEEHVAGRLSARHVNAADWFQRDIEAGSSAFVDGARMRTSSGEMVPSGSRDPESLWPAEASADRAIRLRSRFRTLGPLAMIVWRALQGAEMAELAPAWKFPQRYVAAAGRIRLRAGLELCARMAEREVDRLAQWEVLEVASSACDECSKLEAKRRMRVLIPANDNNRQCIAA